MNLNSIIMQLLVPLESDASYGAFLGVCLGLIIAMGVAAIAAIVLVMLTPANSEGIDALGGSSETFYGKNKGKSTESKLKLGTIICLAILAVFAIAFSIVLLVW